MGEPTQHQREYIEELKSLSKSLSIIIIKGDSYSGERFYCETNFSRT